MGLFDRIKQVFLGTDQSRITYVKGVSKDMRNAGYEKTYRVVDALAEREEMSVGEYLYNFIPNRNVKDFFSVKNANKKNYVALRDLILDHLDEEKMEDLEYSLEEVESEGEGSEEEFIEKTKRDFEEGTTKEFEK